MKKLLITLGLSVLTLTSALAQGTIAFGNGPLTRVTIPVPDSGGVRSATIADGFIFTAWFGPAGSTDLVQAPGQFGISAANPGIIDAPSAFALPGTEPDQVVSLQIRMQNPQGWYGVTKIAQVALGQTGAGKVIWQTASGTNPNLFTPLIVVVPEPSTLALGALGVVLSLVGVRRRSAK